MTDLRNLELYEDKQGGIFLSRARPAHSTPVPAVVGITVAEIEEMRDEANALRRHADQLRRAMDVAVRERDEALTERDEARAAAARYREALERIVAQLDPLYRIASDATAATDLAREALGE